MGRKFRENLKVQAPAMPAGVQLYSVEWPRAFSFLSYMAESGCSLRFVMARHLQPEIEIEPDSGSIKRLFASMARAGLIHLETVLLIRSSEVALVRLTEHGKDVLHAIGITRVVKSEWEQLAERGLSGQDVSMTLEFLYHARGKGWVAHLVEKATEQSPDVFVRWPGDVDGWNTYIVTEAYPRLSSRYDVNQPLGICTTNPSRCKALVAVLRPILAVGAATDLQTLIRTERKGIKSELWMEKWGLA